MWPKKVGAQIPPAKNSDSRVLCKWKNFKKFLTSNLAWSKKVGAQTPSPVKISESTVLCKWKNSTKFFGLKFGMTKKKWCPEPLWKIQTRELDTGKNSKKFLTSNLTWPKKVGALTPLPRQIQSPECSVNKKFRKLFDLKFSMTNKISCKVPPTKNSESTVFC